MNEHEKELLFFNLLENELDAIERKEALQLISSDAELAEEWKLWQMTVMVSDEDNEMDVAPLLAITETKRGFIFPWRAVVAACLLIGLGLTTWLAFNLVTGDEQNLAKFNKLQDSLQERPTKSINSSNPFAKESSSDSASIFNKQSRVQKTERRASLLAQGGSRKKHDPVKHKATSADSFANNKGQNKSQNKGQNKIANQDSFIKKNVIPNMNIQKGNDTPIESYATVSKKTRIGSIKKWLSKQKKEVKKATSKPQLALNKKDKKVIISNKKYALTIKR